MKIPFVDLKAQYNSFKDEMNEAINNVLNETAFIGGKYVNNFTKEFAEFIGGKYCVPCGNGTDAIQIALYSMGIGAGDEVLIPAMTFIATCEAVSVVGAKPVFVDVHPETYTIDPRKIEEKITVDTKAIIPVHLYGQPADMAPIMEIAKKYKLKVIEDSAQAHGAIYKGNKIGTIGDVSTFSFYPGKNLGAYGDGGAIVTNDESLAKKMKMYANHGRMDKYNHEFEGISSRLDGLQAAVLSVKLKYISGWNKNRRQVAAWYDEKLKGIKEIKTPFVQPEVKPVSHLYVIKAEKRDELREFLTKNEIASGIHYPIGMPFLKAYEKYKHTTEDFPVTYNMQQTVLSLPVFPEITEEQIDFVVEKIKEFYR